MSEGSSKQIGETISAPVFAWMRSYITGRLMPIIFYDYIGENEKARIVERHEIPMDLRGLSTRQLEHVWPRPVPAEVEA